MWIGEEDEEEEDEREVGDNESNHVDVSALQEDRPQHFLCVDFLEETDGKEGHGKENSSENEGDWTQVVEVVDPFLDVTMFGRFGIRNNVKIKWEWDILGKCGIRIWCRLVVSFGVRTVSPADGV